jgi:hypothetical protein
MRAAQVPQTTNLRTTNAAEPARKTAPYTEPDGTLFVEFLAKLNAAKSPNGGNTTSCFAVHCDWRIPTVGELRSLLTAEYPNCTSSPCIDPAFGPTQATSDLGSRYWTSSRIGTVNAVAWTIGFFRGSVAGNGKVHTLYARAVRAGGGNPMAQPNH